MRYLVKLAAAILLLLPAIADADPSRLPQNTAEEVAVETALSKGYISRDDESISHEGIYNGMRGSCDLITVRATHRPDAFRYGRTEILNYQVCNGRISESTGAVQTDFGIPEGIDEFARSVALQSEKNGSASGDYKGFKVLGRTVRSEDKCSVEVRIMWEGKLYSQSHSACTFLEDSAQTDPLHFIPGSRPSYLTWL